MAQEVEIKIKAAVESAQAAETLGQLKKSLTELQALAEDTEIGSGQFQELQSQIGLTTNRLAETSDRLGDVGDKLRTLTGTPVERLNASFGLLKESIFNLDIDKAKIAVDGLVNSFTPLGPDGKVLTGFKAMGPVLSSLSSGVMSLGQTFVAMGRALLMNPIFLLATAITGIVVGVVALLKQMGLLKPMMDAIGSAVEYVSSAFDNLTQAIGLTTAASDRYLTKVVQAGEEERAQIDETYRARVSVAQALEGLDSRQIARIGQMTGFYLNQDRTLAGIQLERANKERENTQRQIDAFEEIKKKNGELNEDQIKKLKELTKEHETHTNTIVSLEAAKVREIGKLNDEITQSSINRDQNEYSRAKRQRDFDIEQAQRVSDDRVRIMAEMDLLRGKTDAKSIKQFEALQEQMRLIGDRMREKELTAQIEYSKKVAELNAKSAAERQRLERERIENEKKLVKSQLESLIKENNFLVEETKKGSKERLTAELNRINSVLLFERENMAKLEISYEDMRLKEQKASQDSLKLITEYEASEYTKRNKVIEDRLKVIQSSKESELNEENIYGKERLGLIITYFDEEMKLLEERKDLLLENEELSAEERLLIEADYNQKVKVLDEQKWQVNKYNIETTQKFLEDSFKEEEQLLKKNFENYLTFDKRKAEGIKNIYAIRIGQLEEATNYEIEKEKERVAAIFKITEEEAANHSVFLINKEFMESQFADRSVEIEKEKQNRLKELRDKELSDHLTINENMLSAVQGVSDVYFQIKMNKAKGNAVQEEKLARKQFEVNKALQVGAAIIDGIRAVQTSLAFAPLVIGVAPNPAGIANLAYTLVASAANIAKILSTQYQSKSFSAAGGSPPSVGGGGVSGAPATPTFSPGMFYGLGGQAPVPVGVGGPNTVGPQKVYVVETDITSTQRNVRGIEQKAEIE